MTTNFQHFSILAATTFISLAGMATTASAQLPWWICHTYSNGICITDFFVEEALATNQTTKEQFGKNTLNRIDELAANGLFKEYENPARELIKGHRIQRTCEIRKLLDMVEKSVSSKELLGNCYKNIK